jgi:D-cysteine desulfhydrase
LGGDKSRKLSFELAEAVAAGGDTLVTCGSAQSNHARLTTAAARRLGMDAVVVLSDDERRSFQGNLLTVHLMGARVRVVETEDHWDLQAAVDEEMDRIRDDGGSPYFIPISGTTALGSLAGVEMAIEILEQLGGRVEPDAIYMPFGTGGGFTGMLLGLREMGVACPVIGISVNRSTPDCLEMLDGHWSGICGILGIDPDRDRGRFEIYDEFVGRRYGDATPACMDAIAKVAATEGVLLDPVYSGKTFAGLLAHCWDGRWDGRRVVAVHTGGAPALFAYADSVAEHFDSRS